MMKRLRSLLTLTLALATLASADAQARITECLNFGWRFHPGDLADGQSPTLDDSAWRLVDVPHDFQIEQPWVEPDASERPDLSDESANVRSRLSARGFKEMGIGWYRKTITPPAEWKGRRTVLDFEGIMYVGDVYLNGEHVGATDYGYVGFEIDLTGKLRLGEPNLIAVKANTQQPLNSRWYTGGGLYRDVTLRVTDAQQYFTRHPLYITTPRAEADEATVRVQAELYSGLRIPDLHVRTVLTAPDGAVLIDTLAAIPFNRKMKQNEHLVLETAVPRPRRWSPDDPALYTARVELLNPDGTVADDVTQRFGIRKVEFSPEFGMKLNDQKVILKGIANHHSLGALGAAVYPRAIEKRLRLLKDFGFNHIRTSHNPYSASFLDLCDEVGLLVVDELYDKWLTSFAGGRRDWTSLWLYDLPEWVKRDRNHPSVVVWSLGNELQGYWELPFHDWGVTAYRMMKPVLQRYDATRPITVAMHPRVRDLATDSLPAPLVHETDIASYNYRYMYFPGDGRRFPHMIFYQSEANLSMMGPNYYEMDLDKVTGLAYWGMIDYLGESMGWPAKGWTNGVFEIGLEPKPNAWMIRSMFKPDEPTVHIGVVSDRSDAVEWNGIKFGDDLYNEVWNRTPGAKVKLTLFTNADEVELRLNGKPCGRYANTTDPKTRNKIVVEDFTYQPGTLEAIAYRDGKRVASHRLETTGPAVRLAAQPDNDTWHADGLDLQHVRIVALDAKGRQVRLAQQQVTFRVEGPARIVGVINGDMTSHEMTTGDVVEGEGRNATRSLYNGTCSAILRSARTAGPVTLTATAPGLKPVTLKLQTR